MAGGRAWWRAYAEAAHDPKLDQLNAAMFRHWFRLMCLACGQDGCIPAAKQVAHWLQTRSIADAERVLKTLHECGLLDLIDGRYRPHNWEGRQYVSDSSTERTRRYRERHRDVPSDAPEQSRTEQSKEEERTSNGRYAFEYGCVRLTEQHLGQWTEAYSHLDLKAEMIAMEPWARSQGKRWFQALSGLLAKRNREAKLAKEKRPFNYNGPEGVI